MDVTVATAEADVTPCKRLVNNIFIEHEEIFIIAQKVTTGFAIFAKYTCFCNSGKCTSAIAHRVHVCTRKRRQEKKEFKF